MQGVKNAPITVDTLIAKHACKDQVALFREHFPNGAPMTVEGAVAVANVFSWDWAAKHLLSATARKACEDATATARKAYNEVRATAFARAWLSEN